MTEIARDIGDRPSRHLGLRSAAALVVANIIGAGIFTTTGFQAQDIGHPLWILLLWAVGGALALAGALCYAELGALLPRAGAEYAYLRETYGPLFGFATAFVSLVAGFSAPIAAAARGFSHYASRFLPSLSREGSVFLGLDASDLVALLVVWGLVAIHTRAVRRGVAFNDFVTLFKVAGIAAILLAAVFAEAGDASRLFEPSPRYETLRAGDLLTAFATSLVFVMFCYSGFNAAAYLAAEMRRPQGDLPKALVLGTGVVVVLYLGLNAVYFYGAGVDALAGEVEVGRIAARNLFGEAGESLVAAVLCVSILASASAMTMAGPRVYQALGLDFRRLRLLARTRRGTPVVALVLQGLVTSAILLSGSIDQIQQYAGFTLALFSSLAVSCVVVLRVRHPEWRRPFTVPLYPWTPAAYLAISCWMMVFAFRGRPWESVLSLCTVFLAAVAFFFVSRREPA